MRTTWWTFAIALGAVLAASPARGAMTAEQRIRMLEEELRKTQQELQELKAMVKQQQAVGQATQKQVEETRASVAEATQKAKASLPDWLARTTLFGDVRFRHEGFYHQPAARGAKVTARNRERIRARLGLRFAYSDEIAATFRLASGNPDDPISPNETLTGDFTRKHVNLDWAYLTFTPGKSFGLRPGVASINLGKFPNPVFRVGEMVWDDDLSPEGAFETFALLGNPIGALDQVRLHALQWTFNEVSNGEDGWMFGGQVNPAMHFGNVLVEAGVGQYWYLNPDQIAMQLNTNTALANTNQLVTTSTTSGGKTTTRITGYASGFNESNATVAATIPSVVLGQPLRLFADYVYNWDAFDDDASGWQAGARLGQTKVKNDWSVYGFYEQIAREAALSAFTYSDFGLGGTNQEGPVVGVDYQLLNPLTLSVRSHFTNFIDRPVNTRNPTLTRLQLDAAVKF
ncbi:MAG TPA: putative porin [Candidatus Binatia bacterium]|nr:putative porin [Candidatus Binatia bacterium]